MTTLFERLVGDNLPEGGSLPEDEKIAIHAFIGAMNEFDKGKLTAQQVSSFFGLDAGQDAEALVLRDKLNAAPDKERFIRVFKDWLYMGEVRLDNQYLVIRLDNQYLVRATLLARLDEEITDQGGTVP
jgi:hypothetical protein